MDYEQWKKEQIEFYKQSIEWANTNILIQVEQWSDLRDEAEKAKDGEVAKTFLKWAAQCLDEIKWLQGQKERYEKNYKKYTEDGE